MSFDFVLDLFTAGRYSQDILTYFIYKFLYDELREY